jgi:hypothetical protein
MLQFFIFLCIAPFLFSQSSNKAIGTVSISSPDAAALGKFGDIPVSEHTGIPEINLPVYTIQAGALKLPISLSYHASGMKVQEQASRVGAGWALNAGGVITRTVVGAPDDKGLSAAFTQKGHFSDYGYNSYIFNPGPSACGTPVVCPAGTSSPPQDSYIQDGIFDGEPDLYFFNFNGYAGKFYFNDDRTPVIEPEQDLKITPIYPGNDSRGITGFTIQTPDGAIYYFGKNQNGDGNIDAIDLTYNVSTQMSYTGQGASSAWYLNKIVSADAQSTIVLTYAAENYSFYSLSMYPIPSVKNPNWAAYNYEYDIDKNFINGVRLSKINFPNGEVDFNTGSLRQDMSAGLSAGNGLPDNTNSDATAGAYSLGSISITAGSYCKKFAFTYGYFYDASALTGLLFTQTYPALANIHSDQYRLRLDKIQEQSCNVDGDATLVNPPYIFTYNSGTVPRKLSFGIDHWGFYNGVTTNASLIPTYWINTASDPAGLGTQVTGANRDAAWPNSQNGMLQQITYPTGGNTSFVYESNNLYTTSTTMITQTVAALSVGFDGSLTSTGSFTTLNNSNSQYQMTLDASYQPSGQSGGKLVMSGPGLTNGTFYLTQGQNVTNTITLTPNSTYTYVFTDQNNQQGTTGHGLNVYFRQLVPSTTSTNLQVGGTRIKTITTTDGITATPIVTSYNYNFNNVASGQSSGILFSMPVYVQPLRNDVWATVNGQMCSPLGCFTCFSSIPTYYQSPSSIRPMASSQGNHIGYSAVYVAQSGNGYTYYQFYGNNGVLPGVWTTAPADVCVRSFGSTTCDGSIPNSPAAPLAYDPTRGLLAYEAHYDQSGRMVHSKNYTYTFQTDPMTTPGIISKFFVSGYQLASGSLQTGQWTDQDVSVVNSMIPVGVYTFTEYLLQSAKKVQDKVVSTTYDPATGNNVAETQVVNYNSPWHYGPTQTTSVTSKGENLVTNITSSFDLRVPNSAYTDPIGAYTGAVQTASANLNTALAATQSSDYWSRLNAFIAYRYSKATARQQYIATRQSNASNYASVFATAKAGADASLGPVLRMQELFINQPIETSTLRNSNLIKTSYYGYGFGTNPATVPYPVKIQSINISGPAASYSGAAVSGNKITKDARYYDEENLNFDKGNITKNLARNGVPSAYLWDYNNQYPIAKISNADPSQTACASFEADGYGNWNAYTGTITTATTAATMPPTGTKYYNLTSTTTLSKTVTNGAKYVVSYWSKNGAYTINGGSYTSKTGRLYNSWTYYEHMVTATSTTLTITGTGSIDEVRLYPADAQMASMTYMPLVGMTSQCDANNRITYYEYDSLGRLKDIKDMNGNILKAYDYKYQQVIP